MTTRRIDDPNIIEQRLLELAYTTDSRITASSLAFYAPCSIDDAERVLDKLVTRARISLEVHDDGMLEYVVPDRQKLQPRREPVELHPVPHVHRLPLAIREGRDASPALAAILSVIVPGAGQLYAGRSVAALLWFLLVTAGYALILPGLILHLFCIVSAASSAHRLNSTLARLQLRAILRS